ncbi:hypothetical protein [Streptosporangium sp. NPDC002721]|uniref:hypothetical protein n=1 Tax=Streptosporangium sp. NPDC002721 TaxID=3366188 RepID=UPI00369179E0
MAVPPVAVPPVVTPPVAVPPFVVPTPVIFAAPGTPLVFTSPVAGWVGTLCTPVGVATVVGSCL